MNYLGYVIIDNGSGINVVRYGLEELNVNGKLVFGFVQYDDEGRILNILDCCEFTETDFTFSTWCKFKKDYAAFRSSCLEAI